MSSFLRLLFENGSVFELVVSSSLWNGRAYSLLGITNVTPPFITLLGVWPAATIVFIPGSICPFIEQPNETFWCGGLKFVTLSCTQQPHQHLKEPKNQVSKVFQCFAFAWPAVKMETSTR